MATSGTHPRRRPLDPSSIDALAESMQAISLQKGSTFQATSKEEPELLKNILRGVAYPNLQYRSVTCPKALEDLLIGSGERRTAELLQRVDDAITRQGALSATLREPEVLPASGLLGNDPHSPVEIRTPNATRQSDKDSGLGSSIVSTTSDRTKVLGTHMPTSAITHSFSSELSQSRRMLSPFAVAQVDKYLSQPLLREAALQHFHPLIKSIPDRIASREIGTIRDLEKTLIFLAPDYSRTPKAYQAFCVTSIRCLHLTVNNVHDTDRALPADRPYSTNYFIDLVEQIRRYAAILASTREKQRKGEPLDDRDADLDEHVELHGGMTQNGKPAQLVRVRGEQHVGLADGRPLSKDELMAATKRPAAQTNDEDDSALRSMARRKKGEPIRTYFCKQPGCTKHFKRPCDLTKHIKTHERPFKCPELDCKYYDLGWPTEKECERHVNDKHSDTPTMYKCAAEDCPYTSKRESNCKQHMEKAHNIPYVRSKSKGKGKAPIRVAQDPSTPSVKSDTVDSMILTPPAPSPSLLSTLSAQSPDAASSVAPQEDFLMDGNFDFNFNPDFAAHFNTEYLDPSPSLPITPSWTDDRQTSAATSITSYSPLDMPMNDFDNQMFKAQTYDFGMFGNQVDFQPAMSDPFSGFSSVQQGQDYAATDSDLYVVGNDFGSAATTNYDTDFQLYTASPAGTSASLPPVLEDTSSLDHTGSQYILASQGQTDLMALFPELNPL